MNLTFLSSSNVTTTSRKYRENHHEIYIHFFDINIIKFLIKTTGYRESVKL